MTWASEFLSEWVNNKAIYREASPSKILTSLCFLFIHRSAVSSLNHLFAGEVHEPIMLLLEIKDENFSKFIEYTIGRADLEAFVCEVSSHFKESSHLSTSMIIFTQRETRLEFIVFTRIGEKGLFVFIFILSKDEITQPCAKKFGRLLANSNKIMNLFKN